MGLGNLGEEQIERLREYLTNLDGRKLASVIVLLHHAPVRRQTDEWSLWQVLKRRTDSDPWDHTFLALDVGDSRRLVDVLGEFAQAHSETKVIIVHGHRHDSFYGRLQNGVWVVEAPAVVECSTAFWAAYVSNGHLQFKWIELATPPGDCWKTERGAGK